MSYGLVVSDAIQICPRVYVRELFDLSECLIEWFGFHIVINNFRQSLACKRCAALLQGRFQPIFNRALRH